jgi:hypothetical protein
MPDALVFAIREEEDFATAQDKVQLRSGQGWTLILKIRYAVFHFYLKFVLI